ncbi:MAG: peptidase [Frankiales bacterium]|nr:peptidase [Frankiales bacterium]
MKRSAAALLVAAAVSAGLVAAPSASAAQAERDGTVTSFDGTKVVYAFFPAPGASASKKAPTVMNGPGYASAHAEADDTTVAALLKAGYNVLTWDPRGFGGSGGNVETDSPAYEGRDAQALVDLLAKQPEVQLDRAGDPRLGMIGGSYGGGIQYVLAAIDQRVDVITPQIAWQSLVTSLDKNDTAKAGWGSLLYGIGTEGSSPVASLQAGTTPAFGRMQDPATTQAILTGATTGSFDQAGLDYFSSRGPGALVSRITIPTLITQGTDDTLFTLSEAIRNHALAKKAGIPVAMTWFCGGLTDPSVAHGVCLTNQGPDPAIVLHQSLTWLQRYLRKDTAVDTGPGFRWVSDKGVLRYARSYPVAHGTPLVGTGSGTLVTATGDTSGAVVLATKAANAVTVTVPAPKGAVVLGEPLVTLTYSGTAALPDGRVYAQLVEPKSGRVLGNQVTPVKVVLDGASHTVTVPLEAVAADAAPGATYELQLTGGSSVYFAARQASAITFSAIKVGLPTVAAGAASTSPKGIPAK